MLLECDFSVLHDSSLSGILMYDIGFGYVISLRAIKVLPLPSLWERKETIINIVQVTGLTTLCLATFKSVSSSSDTAWQCFCPDLTLAACN